MVVGKKKHIPGLKTRLMRLEPQSLVLEVVVGRCIVVIIIGRWDSDGVGGGVFKQAVVVEMGDVVTKWVAISLKN